MDVTSENFQEVLPGILNAISNCTFIAIDTEITGISMCPSEGNAYDTLDEYYRKIYGNSRQFLVIQYGISAFRFDETSGQFKHSTYNFYVFRRPYLKLIKDSSFASQTSCIDFLRTHNFDFNRLFKFGLSYMIDSEEIAYKEYIDEKEKNLQRQQKNTHNTNHEDSNIIIPDEWQSFIQDVMDKIEGLLTEPASAELDLPKCNSFVRKLIYQEVHKKYTDGSVIIRTKFVGGERTLVASKRQSLDDEKSWQTKEIDDERQRFDEKLAFTKVLKCIIEAGKPVIVHNGFLDLFHTVNTFLTKLSTDFAEFKQCLHDLFPRIIDTKYMASSEPFHQLITSTVLKDLCETVNDPKQFTAPVIVEEESMPPLTMADNLHHTAGYDAFLTGWAFTAMWQHLPSESNRAIDFDVLEPYVNRVFLMRLQGYNCMDLAGSEVEPNRDHIVHMTFPKTWKTSNLVELFSPFGNVHVAWINETSAYVALHRKDQIRVALSTLSQSDTYSIETYARHKQSQQQINNSCSSSTTGALLARLQPSPTTRYKRKREEINSNSKPNSSGSSSDGKRLRMSSSSRCKKAIFSVPFDAIAEEDSE